MTLEEKLNNPFGLKISNNAWQGKETPTRDLKAIFESFVDAEHGIRAGAKNIVTHYKKYGDNTIRKVVMRCSPPSENDVVAYINDLEKRTEWGADEEKDLTVFDNLFNLGVGIICHENGELIYSLDTIEAGVKGALA